MTTSNTTFANSRNTGTRRGRYEKTTLVDLAQCIFRGSDREALRELHDNRTLFHGSSERRVLMAEFLLNLKDRDIAFQWCGHDAVAVECAYDLTLAKFLNLPAVGHDSAPGGEDDGPDCRYYYKAFHDYVTESLQEHPTSTVIETELGAAEILQRMVTRHFYLSCLECRRRTLKLVKRYCWRINGRSLTVWLPIELAGGRCRTWLEANVPDVDPSRPGERDRIQTVIDRLWSSRRVFSLDRLPQQGQAVSTDSGCRPSFVEEEMSAHGLAGFVAEEKAANIAEQRPAIRTMGEDRLKELIRTVFGSLAEGQYHAERIAGRFGLSKATFSRFAGCQWSRDGGDTVDVNRIPDLWVNTAHVLAAHEDFVAVAQRAGVWNRVSQITASDDWKGVAG